MWAVSKSPLLDPTFYQILTFSNCFNTWAYAYLRLCEMHVMLHNVKNPHLARSEANH